MTKCHPFEIAKKGKSKGWHFFVTLLKYWDIPLVYGVSTVRLGSSVEGLFKNVICGQSDACRRIRALGTKRAEQFRLCFALFRLFCHVWFCSALFRLCSALFCRVPPIRKNESLWESSMRERAHYEKVSFVYESLWERYLPEMLAKIPFLFRLDPMCSAFVQIGYNYTSVPYVDSFQRVSLELLKLSS